MAQDRSKYTADQLREAENLMRIGDEKYGSPEANESCQTLIKNYPDSDRAGCAMLYLAQMSQGDERARYLQECIDKYNDCFYGDGVQVGAYARLLLVEDYKSQGETEKAEALFNEIKTKYADAIDHNGNLLVDSFGVDYIGQQTKSAEAGNYWAKFNLWEAFARGKHEVTKNSAKADQWLAELIKGTYLAKFEPVNGFNPTTPQAMLDQFSKQCGLFSGKESLGGASFFRTTQQDGKLIGSFLTELPDEFKTAVEKSSNFKLISIQKVTPEMFENYEALPQESLKESDSSTAATPASADQIAEGKGWNGFKLGATRAELIQALGQPDSDSDNRWMKWEQAHVHCLVDDARGAFELRFDEGFPRLTTARIGIGSPLKDALAAYGEPSSQENVGRAKKLLWTSKGILIWFHEDKAAQIVVF
jgi:hypothetical protein